MLLQELWALSPSNELHEACLVIMQEDGRVAYATGIGSRGASTLELGLKAKFSDRINTLAPPLPGYPAESQRMSNRDMDDITLSIPQISSKRVYLTQVNLLRWGATFTLSFRMSALTRTYQAVGPTIGGASGQAMYILSFP